MAVGELDAAAHPFARLNEFQGAALVCRNLKWEPTVVLVGKHLIRQADLAHLTDALGLAASCSCLLDDGQEQCRQDEDDHHDHQHFEQCKTPRSLSVCETGSGVHVSARLSDFSSPLSRPVDGFNRQE